jgi:hypothetical protein
MHAANQPRVAGQDDSGTGGGQLSPRPVSRRDEIRDQRGRASTLIKAQRGRLTAGVRPNWRLQANALVAPVPGELLFRVTTGHVTLLRPKRPADAPLCSSSQCH